MSVRQVARLATVGALLGGLVLLGGSPALADDDSVRVGSAGSFRAGGSAEGVNVEVRKRSDGCVMLRTALSLRLDGLRADQVRIQVDYGGRWFPVPASGGGGTVSTSQVAPAKPSLCKGKRITMRYRVAFVAGAPGGRLTVIGEATSAAGRTLGRGSDSARVDGARVTASPTPSKKPSPSPTPVATEAAAEPDSTPAVLAAPTGPSTTNNAKESSGMSSIMYIGLGLVALGALLIGLLVRRSRQDKSAAGEPAVPSPGFPGGTTYRAGAGVPAAPARPGQVYGQPPASGAVYGVPSPRPVGGGVYGSRPAVEPDETRPVPGQRGGHGQEQVPSMPATGGEHTVLMPRLPD
ncbi:hypothetical protein [Micromonospora avicenniae]|uniref:LPXTG-motif cell wall anchor domain-containing protein n=1 Tax=Micromonospora avicenniae TaxID=1198245 RepID=A0A1N7AP00_9ACTN|nr:hypothetical protein [Micromonospora avicenniae]SIR40718.1 hypothetical protein SAMN05444858_109212 [Micromonospora avicenniae]